jgi:hypothetical protein
LTLLDDAPMAPRHNVIRGNTVIRSGRLEAHLATQVRDHGEVEGNRHLESLPRDLPRERWADVGPRPP